MYYDMLTLYYVRPPAGAARDALGGARRGTTGVRV